MQKISAGVFKNFSRFFFILALLFLTLTACQSVDSTHQEGKNTLSEVPEQYLSKIQTSDIKQIERISITGGKDSSTSQNLSKEEISSFTDWMHQLRFHEEISRKEALSSGAVTYYHIFFLDESKLTISPGEIMQINDTYYRLNTEVSTIKPPC